MPRFNRPAYPSKRPAPRQAPGRPPNIADDVNWTRILDPREKYRIMYRDSAGELTDRSIELLKIGDRKGEVYYSVMDGGRPKTFRADRVAAVTEQLTQGHACSIQPQPTYSTELPRFPLDNAVYRIPMMRRPTSCWTVDLNLYTCRCPEGRIRGTYYHPGQLGFVCPHMARAILDNLPSDSGWPPELLTFLQNPRKINIESLL